MTTEDAIEQAREAFGRQASTAAYEAFRATDREAPLGIAELERVALAAHLIGNDDAAAELWGRAHHKAIQSGDVIRAARQALRVGMMLAGVAGHVVDRIAERAAATRGARTVERATAAS